MNTFDSIGFNFDMLCYTYKLRNYKSALSHPRNLNQTTYWVIQNDCGQVWQLCTKIYVATV
jgi:hypothetical protein